MSTYESMRNQTLIAMPGLQDSGFSQTTTFLCEHSHEGALGLVINRPTTLTVAELLNHMNIPAEEHVGLQQSVCWGGPVQSERGFVLHDGHSEWESSMFVSEEFAVTTSKDILIAIGCGEGPENYLMTLGYAGWDAGQLEKEVLDNSWLNTPSDPELIFRTPYANRWETAARSIGIDLNRIAPVAGHS